MIIAHHRDSFLTTQCRRLRTPHDSAVEENEDVDTDEGRRS
ncbi:hypothetical protein EGR_11189 [Echinococcus granulosus]|uniref:Uncharacterized protein n=1 Tax=Echinococcus granulosus TaxID=6210 RepID=W6UKE2_ECHGR|nr:hypothetical protein EGR_11189 [Echinococcus granulosus]EUB53954.1 hypothetical protein EGR_11189 [Echinococcus granulosus]